MFGKTRHAFYDKSWDLKIKTMEYDIILQLVADIRSERAFTGTSKLYEEISPKLVRHNIKMGRDGLNDLLADYGLLIRRKKRRVKTTMSHHWMKKYPNLIEQMKINGPEQVWVSDITYIELTTEVFCYLSLITDAYSKKIMGYCLHKTLEHTGCLKALAMAISNRVYDSSIIHHSDRGVQYCCYEYVEKLKCNQIRISMTESGSPYDNAIAERVNGILKCEFNLDKYHPTIEKADEYLVQTIGIYNDKRLHASCDYLTPSQAHEKSGVLKKRWKNNYKKKVFEGIEPTT